MRKNLITSKKGSVENLEIKKISVGYQTEDGLNGQYEMIDLSSIFQENFRRCSKKQKHFSPIDSVSVIVNDINDLEKLEKWKLPVFLSFSHSDGDFNIVIGFPIN